MDSLKERIQKDIKRLNSLTIAEDYIRIEINLKRQEVTKKIQEYVKSIAKEGQEILHYSNEVKFIGVSGNKVIYKNNDEFEFIELDSFFLGIVNGNIVIEKGQFEIMEENE